MSGKLEQYIHALRSVLPNQLLNPNSVWFGREGHLRLAIETGYALGDFDKNDVEEFMSVSYSSVYVIGCSLRPILDAKEWIDNLQKGLDKRNGKW